jgi:hypothetical protein
MGKQSGNKKFPDTKTGQEILSFLPQKRVRK